MMLEIMVRHEQITKYSLDFRFLYPFFLFCLESGDNSVPEVVAKPPPTYVYAPHYCQFFYTSLTTNAERNLGSVAQVRFNKRHEHTVLKLTWEGNFRKKSCSNCCAKWWFTIDGSACTAFEDIYTSIASSVAYDIFFPTTLTGVCFASSGLPLGAGKHFIALQVGNCDNSRIANSATGFGSSSRIIVEELPRGEYGYSRYHT